MDDDKKIGVSIQFDAATVDKIDNIAALNFQSRAAFIRSAVAKQIEAAEKKK